MIPDHVYHGMLPALRLATTMLEISSLSLTTYAEIGFFANAEPPKIMIFEDYEPNSHEAREYNDELAEIAKYYHVLTGAPLNFIEKVRHYSRSGRYNISSLELSCV